MVSKSILKDRIFGIYVEKFIFSDINCEMLDLCLRNISGMKSITPPARVAFACEDITSKKFYEPNTVVVTHGVLEHFSDEDILKTMATYDTDRVVFQAHYVPTDRYKEKSFGDERLLSVEKWIKLVNPDYHALGNNGKDLYLFKAGKKKEGG